MSALLAWLDVEAETLRRRAVHHAIRQEMELHPVERGEWPELPKVEREPNLAAKRRHFWRKEP